MDTLVENSSSFTEVTSTALEQMDEDEPELFLFNESFDANLFKLKRNNQHHHNLNSTYETSLANFDLINDLNKLYKNKLNQKEKEGLSDSIAIALYGISYKEF